MEQLPSAEEAEPRKPSLDIYLNELSTDELRTKTDKVEELTKLIEDLISLFQKDKDDEEFSNLRSCLEKIEGLRETLTDIATDISTESLTLTTIERRDFHKPHLRQLNLAISALKDLKRNIAKHRLDQQQAREANKLPSWLYKTNHPKS